MNIMTPSQLKIPTYMMNFPFTVSNKKPNNVYMKHTEGYNLDKAFKQWMNLYKIIVKAGGLVNIMPSQDNFQDLPYVANVGAYLPHYNHHGQPNAVLLSNYKSEPRRGEEDIAYEFFTSMKYTCWHTPYHWEGEADLKYIRDNIYFGGHGIRTDIKAYEWMNNKFDMIVIPIKMYDERLYHFDCSFFPLTPHKVIVSTCTLDHDDVVKIENFVEIIDCPKEFTYNTWTWTNVLRINNWVLYGKMDSLKSEFEFCKMIQKQGFDPIQVDLSEFEKSGANLSCMVMHLNYEGRK